QSEHCTGLMKTSNYLYETKRDASRAGTEDGVSAARANPRPNPAAPVHAGPNIQKSIFSYTAADRDSRSGQQRDMPTEGICVSLKWNLFWAGHLEPSRKTNSRLCIRRIN